MTPLRTEAHPATGASLLNLLAGLWLFVSPWIYGAYGSSSAWNSWIIGAVIFLLALIRRRHPDETNLSWLDATLGVWVFIAPWVCGYSANTGRLINSLFVGFVVFCAAIIAANSQKMSHDPASSST
jgi:hypothetical protein